MKKVVISLSILFLVGFGVQAQKKNCEKVIRRIKSNKARKSADKMDRLDKKDPFYYAFGEGRSSSKNFAIDKATQRAAVALSRQAKTFVVSNYSDIVMSNKIEGKMKEEFITKQINTTMSAAQFPYKPFCMTFKKKGDIYTVTTAIRAERELVQKGILDLIEEDGRMKGTSLYFNVKKIQDLFIKQDQEEIE